jgi:hypothetical protein
LAVGLSIPVEAPCLLRLRLPAPVLYVATIVEGRIAPVIRIAARIECIATPVDRIATPVDRHIIE